MNKEVNLTINKSNLIIGLAYGYDFDVIKPFIDSLVSISFGQDVVIIGNESLIIPQEYQGKLNIKVINETSFKRSLVRRAFIKLISANPINKICNVLFKVSRKLSPSKFIKLFLNTYHSQVGRYAFYYTYLKQHPYNNILFTDVRDVVFQSDPFSGFNEKLAVFHESPSIKIKDETFNRNWIKEGFGEDIYKMMANEKIYCSGTILGNYEGIMTFLEIFISTCLKYSIPYNIKGMDQGIFNYLIHTNQLKQIKKHDNGDRILTVAPDSFSEIAYKEGKLFFNSKAPAIVHQYDRYPELIDFFAQNHNGLF